MRRLAISLDALAERENLVLATWKAARGKHDRPAVARFLADLDGHLTRLSRSILDGTAPQGRFREFVIHDPKRRTIHAACFADRVLHHAILNLTEAAFERALVASSFACRPGKGVHAAIADVQRHLRRFGWCVQVDVDGYFPSIDHARLRALLARRFKGAGFLALLDCIVAAGGGVTVPGRGLPIGALTSQHFANAFLDRADRFLLETCRTQVRAHVRYMDDIVWWCDTPEDAQQTLAALRVFMANELGLTLKPQAAIRPSAQGLPVERMRTPQMRKVSKKPWGPCPAWRRVEQPGQERPVGLPQPEPARQPEPELRLPFCPELDRLAGVDAPGRHGGSSASPPAMDQMARPEAVPCKGPGVLVGDRMDIRCRTLPGCTAP
jgi:RNA-directed DNA polymerase